MHPSCVDGYPWQNPTTIDEWKQDPSRKLDTLVEILQYHLESDGRPALKVVDDILVPSQGTSRQHTQPDKIIVYSAFPQSNLQLLKVSPFHLQMK